MFISELLDTVMFQVVGLTSYERFRAAQMGSDPEKTSFSTKMYLYLSLIFFVCLLLAMIIKRYRNYSRDDARDKQKFADQADMASLDENERSILRHVASRGGVKMTNHIFTSPDAFDKGAAILMRDVFSTGKTVQDRKVLNTVISSIREKLQFKKRGGFSLNTTSNKLSSRDIPQGKRINLISLAHGRSEYIEAIIAKTDELEMTVHTDSKFDVEPGQLWQVRYYYGGSTWEFESVTLNSEDNVIVLSHSETIKFVNRRRFLRVAVNLNGYVAKFPSKSENTKVGNILPEFSPIKVTELSGPGIRIITDMDIESGDRVLVLFRLEKQYTIQDVALVRGIRTNGQTVELALEMIGLSESVINELVKATNNAAINLSIKLADDTHDEIKKEHVNA